MATQRSLADMWSKQSQKASNKQRPPLHTSNTDIFSKLQLGDGNESSSSIPDSRLDDNAHNRNIGAAQNDNNDDISLECDYENDDDVVVLDDNELWPTAMLLFAVVLASKALEPIATFCVPVVFAFSA